MLYQLSYTREPDLSGQRRHEHPSWHGGGRIRTFVGVRRQIYSLLPLAARAPHRCPQARKRPGTPQARPESARARDGADEGTRTLILLITNQLLCQLSYVSVRLIFARQLA